MNKYDDKPNKTNENPSKSEQNAAKNNQKHTISRDNINSYLIYINIT